MHTSAWELICQKYDSLHNREYETLFTCANGYRGLRGALEFSRNGERGNFIAGVFDKSTAQVIEIVNCQDPLVFNIYIDDEVVDIDRCSVLEYCRTLDMKHGILYTHIKLMTQGKRIIEIEAERYTSRHNVHRWAAKYNIVPVNFSGTIFIENIIDGTVTNSTSKPSETAKHFLVTKAYDLEPGIALHTTTIDKKIEIAEGSVLTSQSKGQNAFRSRKYCYWSDKTRELYEINAKEGQPIDIVKLGITYTSRDSNLCLNQLIKDQLYDFLKDGYEFEKDAHKARWDKIWADIDIKIEGDLKAQIGIRFSLYQLVSSAYDGDDRVSIAAKALHGEGYKGHVFWDTETFMLPFFIYTMPDIAKKLLMYRYNTLNGAKENARKNGYKGSRFPWESADDGTEVTPRWGFGFHGEPIKIWTGDEEFHISFDITFAIYEYYRATGDKQFMKDCGLEIFFDTAKFCQSLVTYNSEKDRYDLNRVIGPDEFHEHVDNNAYTNYLIKWSLRKTLELAAWVKNEDITLYNKLCSRLGINDDDLSEWNTIHEKIFIPREKNGKLIEQFEGYFNLKDIPIKEYDENGMPLWPEMNGYELGETQLVKQADVVMLMLMLPEEFDFETKKENYSYYEKRTMHKSSLSPSMYSIMGLSVGDTHNSYKYFMKAIMTDIENNQGNTEHGLHAASTGGAWQSAVFGFGGLFIDSDEIVNLNPWIPENWTLMSFSIRWRGCKICVITRQDSVEIVSDNNMNLKIYGKGHTVSKGISYRVNRE